MLPGEDKTREQLVGELAGLRQRVAELETAEGERQRADEELAKHRDYLEKLVGERTAELKALNWHLKQQITEREQAEQALGKTSKDLQLVNLVNNAANQGDSLSRILQLVVQETKKTFSCNGATFFEISEDGKYLLMQNLNLSQTVVHQIEKLIGKKIPPVRIRLREGSLYFKALQAGKPQLINDPEIIQGLMAECTANKLLKKLVPRIHQLLGIASVMQTPLISEGEVIGLLAISRKRPFTESELERFAAIAQQLLLIIKRKRAEEALQTEKNKLQSVIDALEYGLTIQDSDYNILYQSGQLKKYFGDYLGDKCYRAYEGQDKVCDGCPAKKAFKDGRSHSAVKEGTTPSGEVFIMEHTACPVRDASGEIVSCVEVTRDITERKRAEEVLQQSNKRFQDITENALEWVWEVDASGKYTYSSPVVEKILGYKPEEVLEKCFYDLFHPDDRQELKKAAFETFAQGQPFRQFVNRNLHKNGEVVWLSTSGVSILDKEGNLLGYRGADVDITERKRAEEKRQTILKTALDGFWLTSLDGKLLEVNDSYCKMVGYTREELLEMSIPDLEAMESPEEVAEHIKRGVAQGYGRFETRHRRKDGQIIDVEISANYLDVGEGQLFLFTRDITERKRAEEALKESEDKYRTIFENVSDVIIRVDRYGKILDVNERAEECFGYKPEEVIGKNFAKTGVLSLKDLPKIVKLFGEVIRGKRAPLMVELEAKRKDGSSVLIEVNSKLVEKNGKAEGFVAIVRDVTERKRAEEALRESEEFNVSLLESAPNPVIVLNPDTSVKYVNPALEKLTGFSSAEIIGIKAPYLWWAEETLQKISEDLKKAMLQGAARIVELFKKKNGERFWVEITSAPVSRDGELKYFLANWVDITERKQAEETLKESEEKYHSVVENTNSGIVVVQDEQRVFYNSWVYKMLGYTEEEYSKLGFMSTVHPEDKALVTNQIKERLADIPVSAPPEIRVLTKSGEVRWIEARSVKIQWNEKPAVQAFLLDITERKRAEEALQTEKNKLQSVIDAIEHGLTIVDRDYNLLYQSAPSIMTGGYHLGEKCYRVYEARDTVCDGCPIEKAFKDGKSHTSERKVTRPSGEVVFLENTASPIRDAEGKIVSCVEVTRNVTKRKRVEQAVRESEEKYRGLVTNVKLGVFRSTPEPDGRFLEVNPAMTEITGYSREELLEMDVADLYVNPEEREAALEEIASGGGKPTKETRLRRKDGAEIVASDTKVAVKGDSGQVIYFDGIMEDITERKQAEEREEELQHELDLASRLAAVGELAAGVAHEMNNPLTGIMGFSERLLRKSGDDSTKKDVEIIHSEAQRLAKVVKNLLAFARQREPAKEFADINDIVQKTLELRAYELKSSNIEVALDLAADLPQIMVDFHQIQEVFLNIILNAEQVMTEASGGGKLTIKTRPMKDYVRISFADNGPGIPAERLDRVFNPFFTTKGERGGTGLGLSVCHGIVTEHGGRIYARSKPGSGATFLVDLPLTSRKIGESQIVQEKLSV